MKEENRNEVGDWWHGDCRLRCIRICSAKGKRLLYTNNVGVLPWHTKEQRFMSRRGYYQMFPRNVQEPPQASTNSRLYPN